MQKKGITIMVMDGQGGRIGRLLIETIKKEIKDVDVIAVGTNSIATSNMIKGGSDQAATGENPTLVVSRHADYIIGTMGITVADALLGEVTPKMAMAVGQSPAQKFLIPLNKCRNTVIGVKDLDIRELVVEAVRVLKKAIED